MPVSSPRPLQSAGGGRPGSAGRARKAPTAASRRSSSRTGPGPPREALSPSRRPGRSTRSRRPGAPLPHTASPRQSSSRRRPPPAPQPPGPSACAASRRQWPPPAQRTARKPGSTRYRPCEKTSFSGEKRRPAGKRGKRERGFTASPGSVPAGCAFRRSPGGWQKASSGCQGTCRGGTGARLPWPLLPRTGESCAPRSGQCRHRVRPLLDEREDRIALVRGDPDSIAGEREVVDLPGRIVAPDRDRVGLPVGQVHGIAPHRGGDLGIGEELGLHGREGRGGRCTDGDGPHGCCLVVFVGDTGAVTLPGLCDRGHRDASDLVRRAPERVCRNQGVHDGVDGCCVCEGCTQGADRTLRDTPLDKVCHAADTPAPGITRGRKKEGGVYKELNGGFPIGKHISRGMAIRGDRCVPVMHGHVAGPLPRTPPPSSLSPPARR